MMSDEGTSAYSPAEEVRAAPAAHRVLHDPGAQDPADPRPVGSARLRARPRRELHRRLAQPGEATFPFQAEPALTAGRTHRNTSRPETLPSPSFLGCLSQQASHTHETHMGDKGDPQSPRVPVRSLHSSTRRRRRTVLVELAHVNKRNQYS